MKDKLCLRTYGECIRPYMKKKSTFKPNVGRAEATNGPIDGQGIYAFYSMLLDALLNKVDGAEIDNIPDISNSLTTHLKQGEADIHNKFVELAQRETAVSDVEDYFRQYLIPNIPKESLDTINDAIINLINNDIEIGETKQKKLKESLDTQYPERFHAEVLVFVVQRNQNKLETTDNIKHNNRTDDGIAFAINDLKRKMNQFRFQPIEAICHDGSRLVFNLLDAKKGSQTDMSFGSFCCSHSPLVIYGKDGSGKRSLMQSAIRELCQSMKCSYIRFATIYKALENKEISNTQDFWNICAKANVIFIDGINEMPPSGFNRLGRITEKLCTIIGDICQNHGDIKLIIVGSFSDRQETISALKIFPVNFYTVEVTGIPDNDECIQTVCDEMGSSFSALLRRPLYYNAYKSLDIKNAKKLRSYSRYSLLDLFYAKMYRRSSIKLVNTVDLEKMFYVKVPKIAYSMILEPYGKPVSIEYTDGEFQEAASCMDVIFAKYTDAEGKTWFSFNHQDYRDFLAAMYFKKCVDDIFHSVPLPLPNLNLESLHGTTITMLIEAFHGFVISEEDFNGVTMKKNVPEKLDWWKKYRITNIIPENIQKCMNIGFEIGYYLADPLRHPETAKNIYYDGYKKLMDHYFNIIETIIMTPLSLVPIKEWNYILEKIPRKYIELLRRAKEFDKAFADLNRLISYLNEGELRVGLLNQKAKLLMYRTQYSENHPAEDFVEGYKLLKECAKEGSVLSNNLLGRIYASPSPIVTNCLGENIRDQKKGFLHFYHNVKLTSQKKYLALFEKYSYIRCAKMLLHGNIGIISENSEITEENLQVSFINKPEMVSIKYADALLKRADSDSLYSMYLQGVIDYFQSSLTDAISRFKIVIVRESHLGKILPSLFLYQILCENHINGVDIAPESVLNDDIIKSVQMIVSSKGNKQDDLNFERYHPKYILEDIKYVLRHLSAANKAIKMKGVEL